MKHEEYNTWLKLKETESSNDISKKIENLEKEKLNCHKKSLIKCLGASFLLINSIAGIGYGISHKDNDISKYLVPAGIVGSGAGIYLFMNGFGCRKCEDYQKEIDRYKRK